MSLPAVIDFWHCRQFRVRQRPLVFIKRLLMKNEKWLLGRNISNAGFVGQVLVVGVEDSEVPLALLGNDEPTQV